MSEFLPRYPPKAQCVLYFGFAYRKEPQSELFKRNSLLA